MMLSKRLIAAVLAGTCLMPLIAQGAGSVGETAPELTSRKSYNTATGKGISLAQYRGRVVMIDFWATWCGPCIASLPHVKDLHAKYAAKGLVIIGQTDGTSEDIPAFLKKYGMEYVISVGDKVYDPAYGVRGIPHAVLIDGNGKITYVGHAATVSEKHVETALKTVSPLATLGYPVFTEPSSSRSVRSIQKTLMGGRVGSGIEQLNKIIETDKDAEDVTEAKSVLEVATSWVEEKKAQAIAAEEKGDVYTAAELYSVLSKALSGTEDGTQAGEKFKTLKSDPAYRVGESFNKLQAKLAAAPAAIQKRELARFAEKNADNFYGKLATELAQ